MYGPGGYCWRPGSGEQVLVIKAGGSREAPCITGVRQTEGDLEPGEVRISGGTGTIRFYGQGVALTGELSINGTPLDTLIEAKVRAALATAAGGNNSGT